MPKSKKKSLRNQTQNQMKDEKQFNYHEVAKEEIASNEEGKRLSKIIPPIENVEPFVRRRKVKLPLTHLKNPYRHDNLSEQYQLTEKDIKFIQISRDFFKNQDNYLLTEEFLSTAIVMFQKYEAKHQKQESSLLWLQKMMKFPLEDDQLKSKLWQYVFRYWQKRRKQAKFPLYKPNWRLIKKDSFYNKYYLKSKTIYSNLFRLTKQQEKQILSELQSQFQQASDICQKVKKRETLKLEKTVEIIRSFYDQLKDTVQLPIPKYFKDENIVTLSQLPEIESDFEETRTITMIPRNELPKDNKNQILQTRQKRNSQSESLKRSSFINEECFNIRPKSKSEEVPQKKNLSYYK